MIAIFSAGVWINFSEFFRNELLLKSHWVEHYQDLGMTFPSDPINGVVWVVWGFIFSVAIYALSRKFSLMETTFLGWLVAFVLMWMVVWNMRVLPLGILYFAIPLSLVGTFVAAVIINKISPFRNSTKNDGAGLQP